MINFFTTKVRYTKQLDNGAFKKVTDLNLVQAQSFTDAEAMIYEQLGKTIRGEFSVLDISRTDLHDVFFSDSEDDLFWYKTKIVYRAIDLDTYKERNITNIFYVQGSSIEDAQMNLTLKLTYLMGDYKIIATNITKINEIYLAPEVENENEEHNSLIDILKLDNLQVVSIVASWYTRNNDNEIGTPDIFQSEKGLDLEESLAMYSIDYGVIDELRLNKMEVLSIVRDWYHNFYKSDNIDKNHTKFFNEDGNNLSFVLINYAIM